MWSSVCVFERRAAYAAHRKTCPGCGPADLAFCLTCDRVNPEAAIDNRCSLSSEDLRQLVKACAGDWEWAGRTLTAARGDVAWAFGGRRAPPPMKTKRARHPRGSRPRHRPQESSFTRRYSRMNPSTSSESCCIT